MKLKGLASLVAAGVTSGLVGLVLLASQEPVSVEAVPLVQAATQSVDRDDQPNRSEQRDELTSTATPSVVIEKTPTSAAAGAKNSGAKPGTTPSAGASSSPGTAGESGGKYLSMPVSGARLSSPFGYRMHPVLGYMKLHKGQDWAGSCGTPVGASAAGKVIKSGWSGGYGLQVKIEHGSLGGYNVVTTYNHLSSVSVSQGETVTALQGIGRIGSTGMSTGCHLHFEVIADGNYTDPMAWISGGPVKINTNNQKFSTPKPSDNHEDDDDEGPDADPSQVPSKASTPKSSKSTKSSSTTPSKKSTPSPSSTPKQSNTPKKSATPKSSPSTPKKSVTPKSSPSTSKSTSQTEESPSDAPSSGGSGSAGS